MKVTSKIDYKRTRCIYKSGKQIVGTIAIKKLSKKSIKLRIYPVEVSSCQLRARKSKRTNGLTTYSKK